MKKSAVLANRRRDLKVKLQKYEKRRRQVQSILDNAVNNFDDNIRSIRERNRRLRDRSESGFNSFINILNQNSAVDAINERDTYTDSSMSEIIINLKQELLRIDGEISGLRNQISRLDRQINAAIEEERRGFI